MLQIFGVRVYCPDLDLWWRPAGDWSVPAMDSPAVLRPGEQPILGTLRTDYSARLGVPAALLSGVDLDEQEAPMLPGDVLRLPGGPDRGSISDQWMGRSREAPAHHSGRTGHRVQLSPVHLDGWSQHGQDAHLEPVAARLPMLRLQ
uniref:(northern house mosquito) hypothetical protein n=1 Tax=Culex pipiens TaxID=7175 RepID=A0A8D8F622_CULPI